MPPWSNCVPLGKLTFWQGMVGLFGWIKAYFKIYSLKINKL